MPDLSLEVLASDAALLKEWRKSQAFDVFYKYLDAMSEDFTAQIIQYYPGDSTVRDAYHKGVLVGLKLASQVPEKVQLMAQHPEMSRQFLDSKKRAMV